MGEFENENEEFKDEREKRREKKGHDMHIKRDAARG
jgi:hypothetical protein